MRRLAVLALTALASPAVAAPPPALARVADALAGEVGAPPEGRRALLLAVEPRGAAPSRPIESALSAALAVRGYAVSPHRSSEDAEAAARRAGQDWLLRVRAGVVGGEIALVGELIPTWTSFFLQRRPDARALPPRLVQARAPADPETLLLAREARPPGTPFAVVRPLARVAGRVIALAAGEVEPGRTGIVAVTPEAVLALAPDGAPIASRAAQPPLAPVRDPAATAAVGDFGGGRIAIARAGVARAEVLALSSGRLEVAGALDMVPLCAGGAGRLFGAFAPGTGVLQDLLVPLVDPGARPRSARTLYGAAAAPQGGKVAFATLGTDLRVELLGPDLRAVGPAPSGASLTGSGFALADLDGDGTAELVASSPDPRIPERVRVLAPLAQAPLLLESAPIEGAVLAGAAADLTGDGLDDAVLAAVRDERGRPTTQLLLVTADPREVR